MRGLLILAAMWALAGAAHAAPCKVVIAGESVAIDLPGRPFAAVPSPDGCTLYASLTGGGKPALAILTNQDGVFHLDRTIRLHGQPTGLALSPDGTTVAIANGADIALVDLSRPDAAPLYIPDGSGAEAVYAAIAPDGRTLFISDERRARLTVVDLPSRKVIAHVALGPAPVGLAITADGARLYATSQSTPDALGLDLTCPSEDPKITQPHRLGAVYAIDVDKARSDPKHAVVGAVAAECNPVRVALSPDQASLYVTARGTDHLLRIGVADFGKPAAKGEVIKVGRSPVGVAVSGDSRKVWVSNSDRFAGPNGAGSLSLIASEPDQPMTLLLTRPAGGFPRDLRFLPDGETLVSAEFTSSRVVLTAAPVAPASAPATPPEPARP